MQKEEFKCVVTVMSIPREKRGARRLQGKKQARFGVIHANAQKAYRCKTYLHLTMMHVGLITHIFILHTPYQIDR